MHLKCPACNADNVSAATACKACSASLAAPAGGKPKKSPAETGAVAGMLLSIAVFQLIIVPKYFPPQGSFDFARLLCAGALGAVGGVVGHLVGKLLGGGR